VNPKNTFRFFCCNGVLCLGLSKYCGSQKETSYVAVNLHYFCHKLFHCCNCFGSLSIANLNDLNHSETSVLLNNTYYYDTSCLHLRTFSKSKPSLTILRKLSAIQCSSRIASCSCSMVPTLSLHSIPARLKLRYTIEACICQRITHNQNIHLTSMNDKAHENEYCSNHVRNISPGFSFIYIRLHNYQSFLEVSHDNLTLQKTPVLAL
jgi:hypothetical protein